MTAPIELRDRIKELRRVPGRELRANPLNFRKHPDQQRSALAGVLERIGIASALIARETPEGLELIDGHLRAEDYGDADWPVLVLDVTAEESKLLLATLDPLAAMAEHDGDLLAQLVAGTSTDNDALNQMLGDLLEEAGVSPPAFSPDDPNNQGDLDAIKTITCPECGHEFAS